MNTFKKTLQDQQQLFCLQDLKQYAQKFSHKLQEQSLILLDGPLGVGKTQFIKFVCEALKISKNSKVHSPTFSLLNQYPSSKGMICHADLFRLNSQEDLESIGLWDFMSQGSYMFVEWPYKKDASNSLLIQSWPSAWEVFCIDLAFENNKNEKKMQAKSFSSQRQISLYF